MDKNEKLAKLRDSLAADIKKRDDLNTRIRVKEEKITELANLEILNDIKSISLGANISTNDLIATLKKGDISSIARILRSADEKEAV